MGAAFVMLFNDLANTYPSRDKMLNITHSDWKMGEQGIYKTLMINGVDSGTISVFNAYSSGASDQWLYDLNIRVSGGTLLGLALIAGGSIASGGASWAFWGAGVALDSYSIYHQNDITYGAATLAVPPAGRIGAIYATGATIYNGEYRD